jgi:hypothetical protein
MRAGSSRRRLCLGSLHRPALRAEHHFLRTAFARPSSLPRRVDWTSDPVPTRTEITKKSGQANAGPTSFADSTSRALAFGKHARTQNAQKPSSR